MNETKKNIVFVCVIVMLVMLVFSLGFVISNNRNRLAASETIVQNVIRELQFYQTRIDFIIEKSRKKSEIIEDLRIRSRKFDERERSIITEFERSIDVLRNTNSEFGEFGKISEEGIRCIEKGFTGIGNGIGILEKSIKKIKSQVMD